MNALHIPLPVLEAAHLYLAARDCAERIEDVPARLRARQAAHDRLSTMPLLSADTTRLLAVLLLGQCVASERDCGAQMGRREEWRDEHWSTAADHYEDAAAGLEDPLASLALAHEAEREADAEEPPERLGAAQLVTVGRELAEVR
jgi:hypothetical protein